MSQVFVYGTLKRGQLNHKLMTQQSGAATYLGQARTVEKYPLVVATEYKCPFLLDAPGLGKRVTGEVYEMTDELLKDADCIERHPTFYRRRKIRVKFLTNKDEQALQEQHEQDVWAYLLVNFKDEILAHDWLETFDAADHVMGSDVTSVPDASRCQEEVELFMNDMRRAVQK